MRGTTHPINIGRTIDQELADMVANGEMVPEPRTGRRGRPKKLVRMRNAARLATPARTKVIGRDGFPPPVPGIAPDPCTVPDSPVFGSRS